MKRLVFPATAAFFACAALVHCSSSDSSPAGTDGGGLPPPVGGAMPTTMPTPPPTPADAGGDADAGEDATVVTTQGPEGVVEVSSYGFDKPTPQTGWQMLAGFSHPSAPGYTLTTTTIGACKVRVQSAPAAFGTADSAGDVTLTQGAALYATATFNGSGYVVDGGSTAMPIGAGLPFHVAAAGAAVPAFAVDLTSPYPVTVEVPDLPDSGPLVIDRSKDLALSWTGGAPGRLVLIFFGADNGLTQARCELDATPGLGAIPKAVLGRLPAGSGGFTAFSRQGTILDAGGRPVDVSMTFAATSRDLREYQAIIAQYN